MIGIIPAAGKGTRLHELGKRYPKALLPYKEKPLLYWNIKTLRDAGCDRIFVIIGHEKERFEEFEALFDFKVEYLVQDNLDGLSGAIEIAIKQVSGDTQCLVLLGDLLASNFSIKDHSKNQLSVFQVEDYERWCMVKDIGNGKLAWFDKPTTRPDTNLAISGVYYFVSSQSMLTAIYKQRASNDKQRGEFQLSDAMKRLPQPWILDESCQVKDFGTLASYLANRDLRNSREFNDVNKISDVIIRKGSLKKPNKIFAEASWYQLIPRELQVFTPKVFPSTDASPYYDMEYINYPTMKELYLFLDQSENTWFKAFTKLTELKMKFEKYSIPCSPLSEILSKIRLRVPMIPEDLLKVSVDPKILISEIERIGRQIDKTSYLMHGDYCFSNLMFDVGTGDIKMIDPNGTLYGSKYYDWAKLMHSVMYEYDFIDAELYVIHNDKVKIFNSGVLKIKEMFFEKLNATLSKTEIYYVMLLTSSLLLTYIPLHTHSATNQKMFAIKSKEIYEEAVNYFRSV